MSAAPEPRPVEVRIAKREWAVLTDHLFPGDGRGHAAVLLCGLAEGRRRRLLVRRVIPALDGIDYINRPGGGHHLRGEFITSAVREAADGRLAYLVVHNHGGTDQVSFSATDLASHERSHPILARLTGTPVGALVCTPNAVAGTVTWPDGIRSTVDRTVVVGRGGECLRPEPRPCSVAFGRHHRQTLLFGSAGQARLADTTAAVVGAGGVGMLLVQYLARLGVGELVVVDPERVDPTNLPRLPHATRWDAIERLRSARVPGLVRRVAARLATPKVLVARRVVRRVGGPTRIVPVFDDVAKDEVARLVADCDFVFLAADTMTARLVVDHVCHQYLIPGLQVGSKIVSGPDGTVTDVFAVVRHLGPSTGCLGCNGLIDGVRLAEEALRDPLQRLEQRYVDDPQVAAPSVITLNALGAGYAAHEFMMHTVGLPTAEPAHRLLRTRPVGPDDRHVIVQIPHRSATCRTCSTAPDAAYAGGDLAELPTRTV